METAVPKPVIEVRDLSFSYGAGEALCCVDLTVWEGDYLGIVGPNGGGKTTLLKLMLGLLKPLQGSVVLFGQERASLIDHAAIGYVPQKTSAFDVNFPATVRDVVRMGRFAKRGLLSRLTKEDDAAAELALHRTGMWEYRNRMISELSGGQTQRVFISRALATNPKILFLDEPTAGIDHASQDEFYALLRDLHRKEKLTIVLISHDIEHVIQESSAVAYVDSKLTYYRVPSEFIEKSKEYSLMHGHDH